MAQDHRHSLTSIMMPFPLKQASHKHKHLCVDMSQLQARSNLTLTLALHLWSHSLIHLHHLLYKEQIVPSSMLPLTLESTPGFSPSITH